MNYLSTKAGLLIGILFLLSGAQAQQLKIAYNVFMQDSIHKNNYEVFVMNMDGSTRKNITNNKDVAWVYNASGDKAFVISDRDTCYRCYFLYETNADGTVFRKVTELQLEDSWIGHTNNGNTFMVSARSGNSFRFQPFKIDVPTGAATAWKSDTAARFTDFAYSPDGRQIVFSYKANRRDTATHEELFIADADGSNMRQLTRYPENNISAKTYGYKAGAPRWHPTQNFISYVSRQDGHNSIFAITPDGSRQWRISANSFDEGWHDWSPDGKLLVFDRYAPEKKSYEIVILSWDTKTERILSDPNYQYNQAPVFVGAKSK